MSDQDGRARVRSPQERAVPTEAAPPRTGAPEVHRPVSSGDIAGASRPMMSPERRADVQLRLGKAAGQVHGVVRMVADDRYCVDVLNQISAAQKALDGAARLITRNYLERCVTDAINDGDPLIYDELMKVLDRR